MITDKLYKGRVIVTAAWVTGGILVRSQDQLSMSQSQQVFILGNDGYSYEVEPDTLGVYIGINDKNDTPIFTGDILTGMWGVEFVVFYDVESLEYKARFKDGTEDSIVHYGDSSIFEVIGNINDMEDFYES